MSKHTLLKLKQVVHFREFPFGTIKDPTMRQFMAARPWVNQAQVVDYLRSGCVLAIPMGGDLGDYFDPANKANPMIDGRCVGGITPLTDGVWFWPAGLIHFVDKYNVALPREFIDHAVRNGWRVDQTAVRQGMYDYDY